MNIFMLPVINLIENVLYLLRVLICAIIFIYRLVCVMCFVLHRIVYGLVISVHDAIGTMYALRYFV